MRHAVRHIGVGCWLALAACGCTSGGQTGDEVVDHTGSELDASKVSLRLVNGELQVVGEAGATSARATVSVANETTSAEASTTAEADGSFSATIEAQVDDTIEISVGDSTLTRSVEAEKTDGGATTDNGAITGDGATTRDGADAGQLNPSCPALDSRRMQDAGSGACQAAQYYLICGSPTSTALSCLSDDPASCPDAVPDGTTTCSGQCNDDEYAMSCGTVGPPNPGGPAAESAPLECRSVGQTPGGPGFYCCPCSR